MKAVMQIGGNVLDGIFDDLARTGEINPARTLWNIGIGFAQGSTGSGIRDGLLSKLGIEGCSFGNHLIKTFLGGFIDTGIDGVGSALSEQDFDLKSSLIQNLFFNGLDAFISDPVDAVTGIYVIQATDFLLASVPCILGFNLWSGVQPMGPGSTVLDAEDFLVSNLLLPIGSLIYLLFCVTRWGWGFDNYLTEANTGKGLRLPRWFKPYFSVVLPLLIVFILVQGL
jgi:hypothetical protein